MYAGMYMCSVFITSLNDFYDMLSAQAVICLYITLPAAIIQAAVVNFKAKEQEEKGTIFLGT